MIKFRKLLLHAVLLPAIFGGLMAVSGSVSFAQTIKKCKDAQGKWHYGDIAAEECERSKITEINSKGLKVRENDLPPSKEELEAKRAEELRAVEEKKRAKAQQHYERRILSTYENEQSIVDARDRRLASLDKIIKTNERFMGTLNSTLLDLEQQSQGKSLTEKRARKLAGQIAAIKDQIAEYDSATEAGLKKRSETIERYNMELTRYREILERRANLRAGQPGS